MYAKIFALGALSLALAACGGDKKAESPATEPKTDTAAEPAEGAMKIRIATESSFKPFSYLDNQGQLVGFEIDLANALCKEMAADCEINAQDWETLIPSLNAEKSDAIMSGMSITEERKAVVDFSDPYFNNTLVLVGKKGDSATIADIAGKSVGAQTATISVQYLEENHKDTTVKSYDKQDNAYLDLVAGRVDFMMSDIVPIMDWLATDAGKDFEVKGAPIDVNDSYGIAVRKGDELKAKFDSALATLKANGEYDKIAAKYFDTGLLNK